MGTVEWKVYIIEIKKIVIKRACRLASLGMDSDVWKSKLSVFVSAKNVNMDIHIRIHF
jgi:hypothetical protein